MAKQRKVQVEVYSRVVGYFRPVNQWNKGKLEEFHERNEFSPEEVIWTAVNGYQRDTKNIAC
jgi:hypothetical protein